jgi:hypothetical protein
MRLAGGADEATRVESGDDRWQAKSKDFATDEFAPWPTVSRK